MAKKVEMLDCKCKKPLFTNRGQNCKCRSNGKLIVTAKVIRLFL